VMQPGAQFTKTWRLKNVGTCAWKKDTYQLVYFNGTQMGATFAVFPQDVPVGQTFDFSINLVAPSQTGSYRGNWMFKNANGTLFGVGAQANKPWWVDIKVSSPNSTPTPSITTYTNSEVGYRLTLYSDWKIDTSGMVNGTKREVIFSPPNADPSVTYLSISLDLRTLEQIIAAYAQNVPDAVKEDVNFYGKPGIKFTFTNGRNEYYIPGYGRIFLIATDRPNDGVVQLMLKSISFTAPVVHTYEVQMADDGKTFTVRFGDILHLNLDAGYDWSFAYDTNLLIGVQESTFVTLAPGTSSITATGNPKCVNLDPPCASPAIKFTINVIAQ